MHRRNLLKRIGLGVKRIGPSNATARLVAESRWMAHKLGKTIGHPPSLCMSLNGFPVASEKGTFRRHWDSFGIGEERVMRITEGNSSALAAISKDAISNKPTCDDFATVRIWDGIYMVCK